MKKIGIISLGIAILMLFGSCGKEAVEEEEVVEKEPTVEKEQTQEQEEDTTQQEATKQEEEKVEEVMQAVNEMDYMIKPNDWLSKIAKRQYGDIDMWEDIYSWNKEQVGDDPDLIYPFHELKLKNVPKERAKPLKYDYYNYTVENNESLWSIAKSEYDNPYAWIVILRDNADKIGSDINNLDPGINLQLRTKLLN